VALRIALRSRVPGSAQRSRNLPRSLGYRSKPVRANHNPGHRRPFQVFSALPQGIDSPTAKH
jgi:hypothetical protein